MNLRFLERGSVRQGSFHDPTYPSQYRLNHPDRHRPQWTNDHAPPHVGARSGQHSPDGVEVDGAFLIQVSNNPYTLDSSIDAGQRRRVDTGELGVIAISGTSGRDAAALIALDAVGQRNRSRNWHQFTATTFEVRSRSGTAFAGVDGEALDMATPLVFRTYPGGLQLLVPEGSLEAEDERAARNVSLGELLDVARGRA